jgi:hypothetical protein
MTPQERQLVDDLFDRLSRLETAPRDPDAEAAVADGLKRAPHAVYALVQTALVQDEALKRADARIRELSGENEQEPHPQEGFLDTMRNALMGNSRTSVPSVRPGGTGGPDPRWNSGGTGVTPPPYAGPAPAYGGPAQGAMPPVGSGGSSFLGTAAASAAGAIGGALLLNSISSMFGQRGGGSAFASVPQQSSSSPWDNSAANSDLARDAGLGDVGTTKQSAFDDSQGSEQQGSDLLDDPNDDPGFDDDPGGDADGDFGGDFGGDDSI